MKDLFDADTPDHEEWLYDELVRYRELGAGFEPKPLLNPNNRWLVKSAYQKSIRRGDTELALRMAAHLFADDPDGAFRSLATVIVEDIGPTIPGLLAASTVVTLKTVTKNFDPPRLFAGLTRAASDAAEKTRGCCELALGVEAHLGYPDMGKSDRTDGELLFDFSGLRDDDGAGIAIAAYIAACVLRQRSRHGNDELLHRCLNAVMTEFVDSPVLIDLMHSFERNVDRMNLAAVPVRRLIDAEPYTVKDDEAPEPTIIRAGLPDYAFDMHTMQGKRAIKGLYNRLKDKHEVIEMLDPEKAAGVLGAVVFVIDGGIINNRIRSAAMDPLKQFQDQNFILSRGADETRWEELVEVVRAEWSEFTALRNWSAGI